MINIRMQNQSQNRLKPRITVIGVGGAGGNAVNNMIPHLEGCEFLVCNTDAQALDGNAAHHKIQLGANVTRGLGAGANPEIGRAAAEESIEDILSYLEGSNMVFVTAGMGGGTGTGASAVIAQAARQAGILTIGVVTKPFHFEGTHRMKLAEAGIAELQKHVDTLIIIPNQNLFRIANEKTTFSDAFRMADEVLQAGVRSVTDLMVLPGLINLDFADVRAVMAEMGKAMMGTGEAEGERRAIAAAEAAINNPLLDDVSMKGARGVLINVIGGRDLTLFEVDEAVNRIRDEVDPDANIIFGSTMDDKLDGRMRISVVATGIDMAAGASRPAVVPASMDADMSRRSVPSARPAGGFFSGGAAPRGTDFGAGGAIPASILPTGQQGFGARATASYAAQPAMAQQQKSFVGDAVADEQPQQPAVGHAASATSAYAAAATARKLESDEVEAQETPAVTQSYTRTVPSMSQPRASRQGDVFIPPKPVDPYAAASADADLFGEALPETQAKPAKKSPSLFERFTLQRREEAPAAPAARVEASPLSVEAGGKQEDDELDIPAFLRRQAN